VVWSKIIIFEVSYILVLMMGLGFLKLPRFMTRRKLSNKFPWGYYADQVPKEDPGFSKEYKDFLHDIGTEYAGIEGFGDYGEFTGWGELGEYGGSFFADGGSV
jgi:hypothetical protein